MRDFGFAFNDNNFSDRVLRLEIIPDDQSLDSGVTNRKRKRTDKNHTSSKENGDASRRSDSNSECSAGVKFKTLHISSPILAEKSPFFYKLYKNSMRESQERHSTLRITASEEAALMDLLKFMYSNTLSATTTTDLLNVLITADKFDVVSCMRYCRKLLQTLPMSLESALLYLELPPSVLMAKEVMPLKDAAEQYLVDRYKDFTKSKKDMMVLPLHAVEVVLGSAGLLTYREDDVFIFIMKWVRAHYPNLEERREILTKSLSQFICFPNMSSTKLKEVLVCRDFDHEEVSKLVLEALFLKFDDPFGQHIPPSGRVYKHLPIKVVHFEHPRPRCVVYWDLKKQDCATLFPSGELLSQPFCLDGKSFHLWAECSRQQYDATHHFDLFVQMNDSSDTCPMDLQFAVMKKRWTEYRTRIKFKKCTIASDNAMGRRNLFKTSWTNFMCKDSPYFWDGILHLRAKLTINNSQS